MPTAKDYMITISEDAWQQLASLFPKERQRRRGRPWRSHRQILEGIFWALNSNEPWRQMPEKYGPWQTIYDRWTRWSKDGTMDRILEICSRDLDLCELSLREECSPKGPLAAERHGRCRTTSLSEVREPHHFRLAA